MVVADRGEGGTEAEMKERGEVEGISSTPLFDNALRILEVLVRSNAIGGKTLSGYQIIARTGLTKEEFWAADEFLLQQGYCKGTTGALEGRRWLTGKGIEFYVESTNRTPSIQIGAIFQGPVESSQIQAFATAVNSSVQQVVESTDPEALLEAVRRVVEDMVQAVKSELSLDELASYTRFARELVQELDKEKLDKARIHHLLSGLSFLGDLEGAIAFGERALRLAQIVLPYVPVLLGYLNQMLSR